MALLIIQAVGPVALFPQLLSQQLVKVAALFFLSSLFLLRVCPRLPRQIGSGAVLVASLAHLAFSRSTKQWEADS
jgi:hypothetical protein